MNIWDKLSEINIKDKEKYQKLFSEVVSKIRFGRFEINIGEVEKEDYFIVTEENRMNAYFVHIVPKEVYSLFKEMQASAPNEFLGFSVLAGKFNGRDVRVSCFGVPCGNLGKASFSRT